jgi:tRNA threonylcarbamoyladenosine biosynthesis protein TsaE
MGGEKMVVLSTSVEQTQALACELGRLATPGTVVALRGDLGAGKTAFSQGVGRGLEVQSQVQSPTFVVVQEHDSGRLPLFHADLYRIETERELAQIGLDDMLEEGGVTLVEWANLHPEALPTERLDVHLTYAGEGRRIELHAVGSQHEGLLQSLAIRWAELTMGARGE